MQRILLAGKEEQELPTWGKKACVCAISCFTVHSLKAVPEKGTCGHDFQESRVLLFRNEINMEGLRLGSALRIASRR